MPVTVTVLKIFLEELAVVESPKQRSHCKTSKTRTIAHQNVLSWILSKLSFSHICCSWGNANQPTQSRDNLWFYRFQTIDSYFAPCVGHAECNKNGHHVEGMLECLATA